VVATTAAQARELQRACRAGLKASVAHEQGQSSLMDSGGAYSRQQKACSR
jgi:hypothetical protein